MTRLFELHRTQPVAHAIGGLAFVCVLGMALGSLKFRGIGLGTAGVLLAGIVVGHFGNPLTTLLRILSAQVPGQPILRMHCSAICLRVMRFTPPWRVRLVLSSVFYTSASSMYRSICSLRTRNEPTPSAAGGARFSLPQDSRTIRLSSPTENSNYG